MKALHLFLLTSLFANLLLAQQNQLPPQQEAPLYAHLYEINEAWLSQAPNDYLTSIRFSNDGERIKQHLQLVEEILRSRPVAHLPIELQLRRTKALNHLRSYWQSGQFPINSYTSYRMPVFVDEQNTACAVGYLLRATGARETVELIRSENNFADLQELLAYAEVPEWAAENGFTADELAWIQPAYSVAVFTAEPFGNNLGLDGGQVLAMQVHNDELYLAGNFTTIDGFSASYLAAWDGNAFRAFPGLNAGLGSFSRLSIAPGTNDIYAIGLFDELGGQEPVHLLMRYHSGTWERLLELPISQGSLSDIVCISGRCFLSGDFTSLDGNSDLQHIAVLNTEIDMWSAFNPNLQFTARVNDLDLAGQRLLLGGQFTLLEDQDTLCQYVAGFNIEDHSFVATVATETDAPTKEVHFIDVEENFDQYWYRVIVEDEEFFSVIYMPEGETWSYYEYLHSPETVPELYGVSDIWGFVYGAFYFTSSDPEDNPWTLITTPGQSASVSWPAVQADAAVTAVARFQNELIIAGDFTEIDEVPAENIARANFLISNDDDELPVPETVLSTDGTQLFLTGLPVPAKSAALELFDMAGRQVWSTPLSVLEAVQVLQPGSLPPGSYAYRLLVDEHLQVGKVVLLR